MPKIRLILVDDHALFIQGLSAALKAEERIEIIATFSDAHKAFKALEKEQPDLLVTDISMPGMSGPELIKKVRTTYPGLKILVTSMFEPMVSFKSIDGYVMKNSEISEFVNAIKTIVIDNQKFFESKNTIATISEFNKNILTKREKEIVQLIAKELTVDQIAEQLFISRLTVESHKKNIFYKLNVGTNAGLVKKALQLGFIS